MNARAPSSRREGQGRFPTILIDASVRLMNLGRTPPSGPAASSSAASQSDSTVPTSCAKHSVHVLSGFGRPSKRQRVSLGKESDKNPGPQEHRIDERMGLAAEDARVFWSSSFKKYPSWYNLLPWPLRKVKMGWSSGMVSSPMSMRGGW